MVDTDLHQIHIARTQLQACFRRTHEILTEREAHLLRELETIQNNYERDRISQREELEGLEASIQVLKNNLHDNNTLNKTLAVLTEKKKQILKLSLATRIIRFQWNAEFDRDLQRAGEIITTTVPQPVIPQSNLTPIIPDSNSTAATPQFNEAHVTPQFNLIHVRPRSISTSVILESNLEHATPENNLAHAIPESNLTPIILDSNSISATFQSNFTPSTSVHVTPQSNVTPITQSNLTHVRPRSNATCVITESNLTHSIAQSNIIPGTQSNNSTPVTPQSNMTPTTLLSNLTPIILQSKVTAVFPDYMNKSRPVISCCKQGSALGKLSFPKGLAIEAQSGRIYLADHVNNRVQVFTSNGEYYNMFNGNMNSPWGICINNNAVYVSQLYSSCITLYKLDGKYMNMFGREGTRSGQFMRPAGIAIRPISEHIYVCDRDNNRLQIFNERLKFHTMFGINIVNTPLDVKLTNDSVIVLDKGNPCIHVFNMSDHCILNSIIARGTGKLVANPLFFTLDAALNIVLTDYWADCVNVFDMAGVFITRIGKEGHTKGEFTTPTGIAIYRENMIIIVSANKNYGLQIF